MHRTVEQRFRDVLDEISPLVTSDHVANAAEIVRIMGRFAEDKLALRYFLYRATVDDRFRRLTSAQSFYVFGCPQFYLRMNAWYPRNAVVDPESARRLEKYFSIDSCHNHSVDFFTVGLLGPGYVTEFRETDSELSETGVGDRIEFLRSWEDQLTEGRVFFVKKSSLFHTQYAPEQYSVSLNLVIREPVLCKQFTLSADKETVRDVYDFRNEPVLEREIDWF
jgi:hypothetical protein